MVELPIFVQTSELYDKLSPRSIPARPAKLTSGRFQLKLRDKGFSPPPPVSFIASTRAEDESASIGPVLVLAPRVERTCSCSRCVAIICVKPIVRVGSWYAVRGINKISRASFNAV